MTLRKRELDLLAQLAATSPHAAQLVASLARKRGRPPLPEAAYRELSLIWRAYRRQHPELTDEIVFPLFLRKHRERIKTALGLTRNTFESHRKAVYRGDRESKRVNERRRQMWRVEPALSLADYIRGRRKRLVTDFDRYLLEKYLAMQALGLKF
jgi:hypothetical protein